MRIVVLGLQTWAEEIKLHEDEVREYWVWQETSQVLATFVEVVVA